MIIKLDDIPVETMQNEKQTEKRQDNNNKKQTRRQGELPICRTTVEGNNSKNYSRIFNRSNTSCKVLLPYVT